MTSSQPPTVPLTILQADHAGKITSEECQLVGTRWRIMHHPATCLEDSLSFSPHPFSPLKTVIPEQNLSWSLHMNPLSPQIANFSDESTFPFYWHLPLELLANEWQTGEPGFGNNRPIKTVDLKLSGASGWWRHQYARRVTCLDSMERWYRLLPSGASLPCPICLPLAAQICALYNNTVIITLFRVL